MFLILLSGCLDFNNIPEEFSKEVDTGEVTYVDEGDPEDAEVITIGEDNGDTAGEPVEEPSCEFELVTSGNGRVVVGNELEFAYNVATPIGLSSPGYQSVMIFNITSLHPECDDLDISELRFGVNATDKAETGWLANNPDGSATGRNLDIYDLSVDGIYNAVLTAEIWVLENGDAGVSPTNGSLVIGAGETHVIAAYMNTEGVSEELNDTLQLEVDNMIHLSGFSDTTVIYAGDDVTGGTLVF